MANLHLIEVTVVNSTTLVATFNDDLNEDIGVANVTIQSQLNGINNATVLGIAVSGSSLTITCQPLVPLVSYFVIFQGTPEVPFTSLNGTATLYQAGTTNQYLILGPIEQGNPIQSFLVNYLSNQIYEQVSNPSSVSGSIVQMLAYTLSRALYDVRQVKNENYLNFVVNDELKIRGFGPYDRLDEEAAYQILRVGLAPTNTSSVLSVLFPTFPANPVSLLATSFSEILLPSSTDNAVATFNINSFILTVSNINVSILSSVVFTYLTGAPNYTYPIQTLGYQILDSTYDQQYAFSYATLANNQFKLSASILNDPNFSLENIHQVQISYQYRDLGRIISQDSVVVTTVLSSAREILPPLETVFNLQHAPVTDSNGNPGQVGDIVFLDPNAYPPSAPHPAFVTELVFNLAALPSSVGDYAVDYATGTVYVFGQDTTNGGTGPEPPLASYDYLYTYVSEIDYVYDPTSNNLVALPNGSLILHNGTVHFDYEQVFIPGIDYLADVHIENLEENVENRLLASNILQTENSPITNVFRIFNQSSGEVYTINRWFDDKVFFSYNVAPKIVAVTHERASFTGSFNNILFVNGTFTNTGNITIFQCLLPNNQIIAGTQDSLGSSIDTSASFSDTSVFTQEMWFDINEALANNFDRLAIGQYMIDYANGIVYVAVASDQGLGIGTISYKTNSIAPLNAFILSVQNIYYQISVSNPPNKVFAYQSFGNGSIIPESFEPSDEAYLNGNFTAPYQLYNGQVGAFVDASFYPYVTNSIKYIRGLYEFADLKFNTSPINFAIPATFSGQTINVNPISGLQYTNVRYDSNTSQYFVVLNQTILYQSPNITFTFSVIRNSDGANLWSSPGTLLLGTSATLVLSGVHSPVTNDAVTIHYTFSINNLSRIIANYNKGDYFIDYTYVADEIIVSYEYGDNYIDWSQSLALSPGDQYYVSYNVGALRDALQKNFGALINIPDLDQFEVDFPRERYRDALTAALTSFLQGPTISALKNIAQTISHIAPDITEYAFVNWSLGSSLLTPASIQTTGSFNLVPAKYGNGAVVNTPGQTISMPVNSNLRIGEGTFETWIIPEWNGIDNDAQLQISILKDGYLFNPNLVFVGASEYHPEISLEGIISLNKNDSVNGTPRKNKDGFYIYYDQDISGSFDRWYFEVIDGYSNYTDDGHNTSYSVRVTIDGLFYDVKSLIYPQPSNLRITSGTNTLSFSLNFSSAIDQGITFIADRPHYLMDVGLAQNKSRLSIYKDPSGYLNFRVFDRLGNPYLVSGNVSSWLAGEQHQVAAAWTLNSFNSRDEIHLFLDGFEVPNIIRYGGARVQPYLHEKFRTINPEEIAGQVSQNIVGSVDLKTTAGSNQATSSLSFDAYGIVPGAILYVLENGFAPAGYTVINVNGNTLTLSVPMPLSITEGVFSINRQSFILQTPIDIYPNITVSTISSILDGNDGSITTGSNVFSSVSFNFTNEGILPGYLLRIDNAAFAANYVVLSVSGNTLVINDTAPATVSGATFHLYQNAPVELPGVRALRPDYSISEDGYFRPLLTITNGVNANDLILVETLGINNRKIRKFAYQWGNGSNVIQTLLPPPVSINQVEIEHILLSPTLIGPTSNPNVTIPPPIGNNFSFSINQFDQVQSGTTGRTLGIFVSSDRNLNFSASPAVVTIDGYVDGYSGVVSESIVLSSFTDLGMQLNTVNQFTAITSIDGYGSFYNANRTFMTLSVREAFSITVPENNTSYYPVIRYSYQIQAGTHLSGDGTNVVSDGYGFFSVQDINNYLVVTSPSSAVGTYQILDVSPDHLSLTLSSNISTPFTSGVYQILNVSAYRSGFQNGFFLFEQFGLPGVPFNLAQGSYEIEYYTYLSVRIDPMVANLYLGSDFTGSNLLSGVIDETNIVAEMLTDTRIGEIVSANQESITKDFNSLKQLVPNPNTLVLLHYESFPFVNSANFYASTQTNDFIRSSITVNDNFAGSAALYSEPIVTDNTGILDSRGQGTIEFWVSPKFDTNNDPNYRFYFDATSNIIEEVTSTSEVTISVSGNISQVLSVAVKDGDPKIDYFAGGSVEIGSSGAVVEDTISLSSSSVRVSKKVFQVITVKIAGDPTNADYFDGGAIGTDGVTIYLGRQLPNSNLLLLVTYQPVTGSSQMLNSQVIRLKIPLPYPTTNVVVTYVPAGTQGDRLSIFKDPSGYINFNVHASGIDYLVRSPAFWASHTWHRVKATYQFNGGMGSDTIRLFVDGYEQGNILFGTGLIFGTGVGPYIFGSTFIGKGSGISTNIIFRDAVNEFYLGSDYKETNHAFALMSNCRFSDIARPIFTPFGESIDVNWNANTNVVFPVTPDLYTTLLLNFQNLTAPVSNFASLINPLTTGFDFAININDEFGIVASNPIVKQVLVAELTALSPATSQMFITYTE